MAAEAVLLTQFREKVAAHIAGKGTLKPIKFMAFGDGGHRSDGTVIPPSEAQTELKHEVLRKPLAVIKQEDLLSATGSGVIEKDELVGTALSEAALVDEEGDLVAIKNFAPKLKEADERYDVAILVRV